MPISSSRKCTMVGLPNAVGQLEYRLEDVATVGRWTRSPLQSKDQKYYAQPSSPGPFFWDPMGMCPNDIFICLLRFHELTIRELSPFSVVACRDFPAMLSACVCVSSASTSASSGQHAQRRCDAAMPQASMSLPSDIFLPSNSPCVSSVATAPFRCPVCGGEELFYGTPQRERFIRTGVETP